MNDYLKSIKQQFFRFRKPKGSSESEINELETLIGFQLPTAYKQFLLFMGKDFKGYFQGSDCFLKNAISNTKWLPELLAENQVDFVLPNHYLAFFSHQGYAMAWFQLPKENENPPVYFWSEGEGLEQPEVFKTFTRFLEAELQKMSKI